MDILRLGLLARAAAEAYVPVDHAVGFLALGAPSVTAGEEAYFVDILYLQEGKTPEDAKAYFGKVLPIVAGHGLRRITPGFVITKKMSGDIDPDLVNVWSVSDPQTTFPDIFNDPAYLEHVSFRNATFDMSRSHMFMMKAAE